MFDGSVNEFLQQFQSILTLGHPPPWWHDADKRLEELADLGITRNDVLSELLNLKPAHHHRGPEPDDAEPHCSVVHKFKYPLHPDVHVYVKIALKQHPTKPNILIPKIWSFKRWT